MSVNNSDIRDQGSYGIAGQDVVQDVESGAQHITSRDSGSYAETSQDNVAESSYGIDHTTFRTDGSYGIFYAFDEVVYSSDGAVVYSNRTDGSYGSGGETDQLQFTDSGATIISQRDDDSFGARSKYVGVVSVQSVSTDTDWGPGTYALWTFDTDIAYAGAITALEIDGMAVVNSKQMSSRSILVAYA